MFGVKQDHGELLSAPSWLVPNVTAIEAALRVDTHDTAALRASPQYITLHGCFTGQVLPTNR